VVSTRQVAEAVLVSAVMFVACTVNV